LANGQPDQITARHIAHAAEAGDPLSIKIMEEIGFYLGVGLANLINILTPEVIVLGGGVMQSWPMLAPQVLRTMDARGTMVPFDQVIILPAALGLSAGVTGAARAIVEQL